MFQRFRLSLLRHLNQPLRRKLERKQDYVEKWTSEKQTGRHLEFVTTTDGYRAAFSHFENLINERLRAEGDNRQFVDGVEAVFRYFESGRSLAEQAEQSLEKFKDHDE